MILHCTPPYWHTIPNAALGYLKGFLEAQGISVTNVYWNVVLSRKIGEFQKNLANYPGYVRPFPKESVVFYICRHLLRDHDSGQTTADQIFSALYTKEEIDEAIQGIREDIDRYIRSNHLDRATLSGFTLKSHQWLMSLYVMRRLKQMNPDTKVVIGGIYNEDQARKFMNIIEADFAVWGEGEYPLYKLVKTLEEGQPLEEVPQLVYRDGKIKMTKTLAECPPLDEYPFADHTNYFAIMKKVDPFNKSVLIPVWGSRSCPWNKCKFCVLNEGYSYRTRSPENIVKEIEHQSAKHKISNFQFTDSDVAGNRKRFTTLLNLVIQSIQKRKKPYYIYGDISPIFIDAETAQTMKRAGFVDMQIGFEAVSDSLLKKMQKRQKLVHNIQALKSARQCNLSLAGLNIIRGIPTETEDDVIESCNNVKFFRFFLGSSFLEPTIFMLLRGSIFYDDMSEEDKREWDEDSLWREISPIHMVDGKDRFEFFNFYRKTFPHYHLWETFWQLLRFYGEQNMSYTWTMTPEGSLVEEKGRKTIAYHLNKNETDGLIFCDTMRSLPELQKEFSYIQEYELTHVLKRLQDAALLYMDTEGNCISILDAPQKVITL